MNTALADLQHAHSLISKNSDLARQLTNISATFNPDVTAALRELTAHAQLTNALRQQLLPLSNSYIQDEFSRYMATLREPLFAPQITRELEAIQAQHDRLNDSIQRSIDDLTRPIRDAAEAISAQFSATPWMSPFVSSVAPYTSRAHTVATRPATAQARQLPARAAAPVEKANSALTLVATRKKSPAVTARADAEPTVTVPDTLDALAQSLEEHLRLAVRSGSSRLNLPGNAHHGALVIHYRVQGRMIALAVTHGDGTLHHLLMPCSDIVVAVSLVFFDPQHKK